MSWRSVMEDRHGGAYPETRSRTQKEEVPAVLKHIVQMGKHLAN